MASYITSIGTATPEYRIEQGEVLEFLSERLSLSRSRKDDVKAILQNTGIEQRYSVLPDFNTRQGDSALFSQNGRVETPSTGDRMEMYREKVVPLSLQSVNNALNNAEPSLSDVTHLITVSCTGLYAPGLDIDLIKELGLDSRVNRTAINYMGCYAAINALKVADSICRAEPDAQVLVVCVELCSLHFQRQLRQDNLVATALFGDGAATALVQSDPPSQAGLKISSFYGDIIPQSGDEMVWTVGDLGFELTLSAYVPDTVQRGIEELGERLFERGLINRDDIDLYALHPGGRRILEACEEELDIFPEANRYAYQVLKEYGNMSSPTILFVLEKIMEDLDQTNQPKNILGVAFGPGLTLESVFLTLHHA